MLFCVKYLIDDELDSWFDSVFAIRCSLWATQLYSWLLAAHPLLTGRVPELARIVSEAMYFAWLDAIKPYAYLETTLGGSPSRFAQVFNIA